MNRLRLTLGGDAFLEGIALHSGRRAKARILPAPSGRGISFRRTDLAGTPTRDATLEGVVPVEGNGLALGDAGGAFVSGIGRVMAVLSGLDVLDACIEVDGPEMPQMDGSALPIVDALMARGFMIQEHGVCPIEVTRRVRVERRDGAWAEARPSHERTLTATVYHPSSVIGSQTYIHRYCAWSFMCEVAQARPYLFDETLRAMRPHGFYKGFDASRGILMRNNRVSNDGGLVTPDEFARHATLEAMGCAALLGAPLLGHFASSGADPQLLVALLRSVIASPGNPFVRTLGSRAKTASGDRVAA